MISKVTGVIVFILFCIPWSLCAQEEDQMPPLYERPPHKVFKSLSAALAQPDSVFILELKGKKLKHFPREIFSLPHLIVLDLGRNKISSIPDSIYMLSSLEELNMSNNKIETVPSSIGKMKNLKMLSLNRNVIETLPSTIGEVSELQILELWDNEINVLPDELKQLKNLRVLELRGILFSEEQQQHINEMLPNTRVYMSPPCNCKTN